jgi:hypothetical protein
MFIFLVRVCFFVLKKNIISEYKKLVLNCLKTKYFFGSKIILKINILYNLFYFSDDQK